jgi:hypothetical protein
MSTMFFGTISFGELCQPAPSRISNAMEPTLTHRLIAAKCAFIESIPISGKTKAAPVPRLGQIAPKR